MHARRGMWHDKTVFMTLRKGHLGRKRVLMTYLEGFMALHKGYMGQ